MQKILLILGAFVLMFAFPSFADKVRSKTEVIIKSNQELNTKQPRKPAVKPVVEVVYDTDAHSLEVVCSYFCDVTVCVYDELGCAIAEADSMDEVIMLPGTCSGNIHVVIESANWYATANVHVKCDRLPKIS